MRNIPKIASNSVIYVVFNVLQKTLNFLLLPLYTIYLTPDDYGITNVLLSVSALLTILLTFSLQAASARFHYKYKEDVSNIIWGSNYLFIIINSLFWTVIACLFYDYSLIFLVGENIPFFPYALIGILNCCFSPIYLYFQTYLQTTQRANFYVINNTAFFIIQLLLTLYFVVVLHWQAFGVLLAQLIVNFVFAVYAVIALRKYITYSFSFKVLKKSLKYSFPLIPHNLSGWLNGMLDRVFINKIVNLASVGLYSVGYQVGGVINLITMGVNQAYVPFFFENHNNQYGKKKILLFTDLGILAILVIALFFIYFSQEVIYIMTDAQYHTVWPVIIVLVIGHMFDCIYKFYVAVLFLDNTKQLSFITITCALVTCALNVLLIKLIGYFGAALSFLLVQFITSVVVCVYAKRLRPDLRFNIRHHYFEVLFSIILAVLIVYLVQNCMLWIKLISKVMGLLTTIGILLLTNSNQIKEIRELR